MQSPFQHSDHPASVNLHFDHPEVKYFNQLYRLSIPVQPSPSLTLKSKLNFISPGQESLCRKVAVLVDTDAPRSQR